MKYDKLVVIPFYVFEKRTNQLFNLSKLVSYGVTIEYWDVSSITKIAQIEQEFIDGVDLRVFQNKDSFKSHLKKEHSNTNILYIIFMSFCIQTAFIYRELSRYRLDMAYCTGGALPKPIFPKQNIVTTALNKITNIISWKNKYLSFLKKSSIYYPLKYQLNTCKLADTQYKVDINTKIVAFNSVDFQFSKQDAPPLLVENYIVFIDQLIPTHPDNKVVGYNNIDEIKYYNSLNHLFDLIEHKYKCDVVIAAHPVATSYHISNPFNSRKIYFNQTNTLVKHSIGVISHYSTAYSYSILHKKPSIVLTSDEIINMMPIPHAYCLMFSQLLKWPLINIDHIPDNVEFASINMQAYKSYKYNYITNPESEDIDNADILVSLLNGKI